MTIKLHVFPPSPRAFKVLFAAHQLGIDFEPVTVNFAAGAHRTPDFKRLNINQRMPVLEDDGYALWESNAIVQYLAAKKPELGYLPEDLQERMNAVKWQFWESSHWDAACAVLMFENVVKKLFGLGETDPSEVKRGEALIARLGPVLDEQLQNNRYVAGARMTVADLSLAPSFASAEAARFPIGQYMSVQRWLEEMRALPAWKKCTAMQQSFGG